jgi:transmembrane sensor
MVEHDAKRQAALHLIDLETSGHSEESWARLEAWLKEDPTHHEAFSKVESAWRTVGHLQESVQGRDLPSLQTGGLSLLQWLRHGSRSWRVRWWSIGCIILATIAAASVFCIGQSSAWIAHETGPNDTRVVTLDDTTVTLNRNTRIVIRSKWLSKEVRLERGEAAADVTSHWYSSFVMYAAQTQLRDIGTRFDVLLVGETRVEAVVERGAVVITTPAAESVSSIHSPQTVEQTVESGRSASIESGRIVQKSLSDLDLRRRFAWTRGLLVFDGTLAEAVAEFNRYNTRKLVVVNPGLLQTRVGGVYRATDPDSFAKYLSNTHGIHTKRTRGAILVGVRP